MIERGVQKRDGVAREIVFKAIPRAEITPQPAVGKELVEQLYKNHRALITIEEGSNCGFGALVLEHLSASGTMDAGTCKIRTMHLPDLFQDQDKPEKQYDEAGLNAAQIVQQIISLKI